MTVTPRKDRSASPGAPAQGDIIAGSLEQATNLANYGTIAEQSREVTDAFSSQLITPVMNFNWGAVIAFLDACETSHPRVKYGLGAKIPGDDAKPGVDFKAVDCSGFVRAIVRRYVTPHFAFPDGSWVQHQWVAKQGFATGKFADGDLNDDTVRIAFLNPEDTSDKIGHVLLIRNGATVESHGGIGPDSRQWGTQPWMSKMHIYALS